MTEICHSRALDKEIEKKLNQLQQELEENLDKELAEEEELNDAIKSIVDSLMKHDSARINFHDKYYRMKVSVSPTGQKVLSEGKERDGMVTTLVVADEAKVKIAQQYYRPCIVRADYDFSLNYKGNLTAVVEGWLRNLTGKIKASMLE